MGGEYKLALVISDIDRWAQFEWIAEELSRRGHSPFFIILNDKPKYFEAYLKDNAYDFKSIQCRGWLDYPLAILKTMRAFQAWKIEVVHCHFLKASLIGLFSAWLLRIQNRIYTRHHSDFHHLYQPRGVILDKICNMLSTKIIAITNVVKNILIQKEHVRKNKIQVVHHGFKPELFANPNLERVNSLKEKYKIASTDNVVGVVSRHIAWKGVDYIVAAFKMSLALHPELVLVLANARGPERDNIMSLISDIPEKNIRIIEFEKDLFSLYHLFGIFVHCPVSPSVEAFGQVYIEAAAAGLPMVLTRSGIGNDIFKDGEEALIVPHKNTDEIHCAIEKILADPELKLKLGANAKSAVSSGFEISTMVGQLESAYQQAN